MHIYKIHKQLTVLIFLFFFGNTFATDTVSYSCYDMIADNTLYLSTVNGIYFDGSNKIVLTGVKAKEKNITGALSAEIIDIVKSGDIFPLCLIDHTQEENDSYLSFQEEFTTRPNGSDGSRMAVNWETAKVYQDVKVNVNRNTQFANSLYKADLVLKSIILGKLRSRVFRLPSFPGFVSMQLQSKKSKSGFSPSKYETIFYLKPDTIIVKKEQNHIEIIRSTFKLVSLKTSTDTTLEELWAEQFNRHMDKIIKKNKDLTKMAEMFKLYFMIKQNANTTPALKKNKIETIDLVPEKIKAIKFCEFVEAPAPLINEPGRYTFRWVLLSGAVSFDYRNCVIIEKQ